MHALNGRRAVVTGASKGLGRRIVQALAAEGVRVAALARASHELDALAESLGDAVIPCPCDIRSPEDVVAAIAHAAGALGGIDILINNAAVVGLNRVEDASDESVRREIETNLMGPIWTLREAAPHLRAARGHVVNVTSEAVLQHPPYISIYAATKAAMEVISTALKRELAPDVRVTILRLGRMSESSLQAGWNPAWREAFYDNVRRYGLDADNGSPMSPAAVAEALVQILKLPEEISSELVVLRGRLRGAT
jgi:NAD(P)-dependent dehydrogenase (short-subunit alcohol dehydrogenase family)